MVQSTLVSILLSRAATRQSSAPYQRAAMMEEASLPPVDIKRRSPERDWLNLSQSGSDVRL
jgi:hypothetical protein